MEALNIGSFEILYLRGQKKNLGNEFRAFDVSEGNKSDYRELYAFLEFSRKRIWGEYEYSGLFSPRFFEKMNITSEEYYRFIEQNYGCDLFLFHPYPLELSLANDFLELADMEHPGLKKVMGDLWANVFNKNLPVVDAQYDKMLCCHCNYFVGSAKFWSEYSEFIIKFIDYMESCKGEVLRHSTPYTLSKTKDYFLPLSVFAFERSLTLFIKTFKDKYKIANYAFMNIDWKPLELFPGEADFVRGINECVDMADAKHKSKARNTAVSAYYFYRKLKVKSYE